MEKDAAVQNQKVFVSLRSVIALTAEYHRIVDGLNQGKKENHSSDYLSGFRRRKEALEFVIDTLQLPIEKRLERQV